MNAADEELHDRALDRRLLRRLLGYLRPYRAQVALALGVAVIETLVQLAGPYLTKEAIDKGIRTHDLARLDKVALWYIGVLVVGFGIGYLETQIMQRVGQRIMLDLRTALFRHLQRLPVSYFDRNPVGRLMTRVTNDVDTLNELFTSGLVALVGDFLVLIGIVIAMVQLNAELLGVAFSVLPLIAIVTLTFRSQMRRTFREVRVRIARMNAFLNENLTGMSTVQVLNRERRNYKQFREINASHRDANLETVFYNAMFFPLLELIGALAVSLIVWYGGRQVMWTGITLGTLVAFIQYTQRFFRPISDLSEKYGILQQAMASAERVFQLLDTPVDDSAEALGLAPTATPVGAKPPTATLAGPNTANTNSESGDTPAPAVLPRLQGRIEFDHVWFAYQGEHWVLQDVTLTLEPGEKLALVGATGSGKTTLANLLFRFYQPQRGVIRVDGVDLREWDVRALRRRLGLVLQDVFLFSGTVESNLRLGAPEATRERLIEAAREVHASAFIERLPGGYDAVVRERGAGFSSGQKQLIAFARALASDPDILVLDEATASVDTQTEELIQRALRRLLANRTSLVIAHRLSTIQDVDRIVVLHHGRVRENGTHAELIAQHGIYERLYQLQLLGGGERARRLAARSETPSFDQLAGPVDTRGDLA